MRKNIPRHPVTDFLPLYKDVHKGLPMLVCGTGPSAELVAGKDLSDLPVIAVNEGIKFFRAPYSLSLDKLHILAVQKTKFNLVVFCWNHFHLHWKTNQQQVIPAWFSKARTDYADSFGGGLSFGASSVHSAAQLAAVMGANPIYLLGNDLAWRPGEKSHFHKRRFSEKGTRKINCENVIYLTKSSMLRAKKYLEQSKKFYQRHGIKIINISRGILEKYPREDAKTVLKKIKKHSGFVPYRPFPGGKVGPWKNFKTN